MKLISWNIDSLNAGLTGTSTRAKETRTIFKLIDALEPDLIAFQENKLRKDPLKKHQEALAELFPGYQYVWRSSVEPAGKLYDLYPIDKLSKQMTDVIKTLHQNFEYVFNASRFNYSNGPMEDTDRMGQANSAHCIGISQL